MNAVTRNGIPSVARNRTDVDNINFMFSNQIDTAEATDQERSGRCSLFSGLSFLSIEAMKALNVKTFELSEIYHIFWDKL